MFCFIFFLELTFGVAGAGTYGSWDVCPDGSVVIGVKEKVAPESKSGLNAIKLRCTSLDDITSSEGTEGDYTQLFTYCPRGFSHARMATNVRHNSHHLKMTSHKFGILITPCQTEMAVLPTT